MIVKRFWEPVLSVYCYFIYEYTPEEALKKLKRIGAVIKEDSWEDLGFHGDENGKTVQYRKNGVVYYLLFVKGRWYYTLVHECIHLVNMIFASRGIKGDFDNDEFYAYYTSWWYGMIEKTMNGKKKKKK